MTLLGALLLATFLWFAYMVVDYEIQSNKKK